MNLHNASPPPIPHQSRFTLPPNFPIAPSASKVRKPTLKTAHDDDNPVLGTGIFAHDAVEDMAYNVLLERLFLQQDHYPILNTYMKKYEQVVKPHIIPDGRKKSIFANFREVCKVVKRDEDHVCQFLTKELGTSGNVDQHGRLVMKGRFVGKQIENVLRKHDVAYVICEKCKSRHTKLEKTERGKFLLYCKVCNGEYTVPALRTGFICGIARPRRKKAEEALEQEQEPEPEPVIEAMRGPGRNCFDGFVVKAKL